MTEKNEKKIKEYEGRAEEKGEKEDRREDLEGKVWGEWNEVKRKIIRKNKIEQEIRVHEEEVGRKYSRRGGRP